jgi:hypothetical protein
MICNKCGAENPDGLRFCQSCRHKLQSAQEDFHEAPVALAKVEPMSLLEESRGLSLPGLGQYLEAWGVAVAVWLVTFILTWAEVYWPLYPLAGLAGLYAYWRRIGIGDTQA